MKKLLLFSALLLVVLSSFGQWGRQVRDYGNFWTRTKAELVVHIPEKSALQLDDVDVTPQIFVKDNVLYYYSNGTYYSVTGGAADGNGIYGGSGTFVSDVVADANGHTINFINIPQFTVTPSDDGQGFKYDGGTTQVNFNKNTDINMTSQVVDFYHLDGGSINLHNYNGSNPTIVQIANSSSYLNFNSTGSSGYGFRDNAGTMEYKNSAGSWAAFSAGNGIYGGSGTLPSDIVVDGANHNFTFDNLDGFTVNSTNGTDITLHTQTGTGASIVLSSDGGNLQYISSGDIVMTAPGGFTLNGTVGTAGKFLMSNGAAQPTWETVVAGVTTVTATAPINSSGGATPNITIDDAAADGSTKGAASFTANDFDATSGNISIDYTNGQSASGSAKGFLNSTDWNTFNGKQDAINGTGFVKASGTTISYDNSTYVPTTRTVNGTALSSNITLTLASSQFANQGTTTTVLHGNGAGNPSFGSIVNADITNSTIDLTTKVTGLLPDGNISSASTWNAKQSSALTSAHLFVGNVSNVATDVAVTGDVTITNAGVTAIGSGKVTNTMIASMTSANLATILSDETGTGVAVFGTAPSISAPNISGSTAMAGGTLVSGTPALNLSATFPSSQSVTNTAIKALITTAGSASQIQNAMTVTLGAGYTGTSSTFALDLTNSVAGQGSSYSGSSYRSAGNMALRCNANAVSAVNYGGMFLSTNGAVKSTAVFGSATLATNSAINIGGEFYGLNTGTSPTQIGVFAALADYGSSAPSYTSTALLVDNGSTTSPIAVFRDNGTVVGQIADGGAISTGTASTADASAQVDIVSTTKGFLQPRMTTTQRNAISSPATGLSVYNTTTNVSNFYNGTAWTSFLTGTTTNDNASAGNIGEYVSSTIATGSAVALTTTVSANVTSISLTAGDWDITGQVDYVANVATAIQYMKQGGSSTTATLGAQDTYNTIMLGASVVTDPGNSIPVTRFSLSGTTTIYLVANASFTVSTLSAYGTLRARRVR